MSEILSQKAAEAPELVNSSPRQLSRRELGKIALGGALGATVLDWSQSGFAQEPSSTVARPHDAGMKPGIKIGLSFPANGTDEDILFYKQVGVDAFNVSAKPEESTPEGLRALKKRFEDQGFVLGRVSASSKAGIAESDDYLPDIVLNRPGRDKAIEAYKESLRTMGAAGLNYHPEMWDAINIASTGQGETRDSKGREFDLNSSEITARNPVLKGQKGPANALLFGREYSREEIWENYTYFIKQIVPVAEETGVRIGFHPCDPPVPSLFGVPRIFSSFDDYKKALKIANSPNVGVCFCIGCWVEGGPAMGMDTAAAIRYFGAQKKLFEIHFRNVSSPLPQFVETYPDNGYYDMYKPMKALVDVKYDGIVNLDHFIPMVGGHRTYEAFALSYMRALVQRAQREAKA